MTPSAAGRAGILWVLAAALAVGEARADPVIPRFPEGDTHAFLGLRTLDGQPVAHGEMLSVPRGTRVQSRQVWRPRGSSSARPSGS